MTTALDPQVEIPKPFEQPGCCAYCWEAVPWDGLWHTACEETAERLGLIAARGVVG